MVKCILQYVKGTLSYGLHFSCPKSASLISYSDTNWARCIETRRPTYGYSIIFGGNLVSWSAKKQPTVSRSSCESEYCAMANTDAELIWITHLLHDLNVMSSVFPTILCDNLSAIFLSQNPVAHRRVKHIEIDYHFIWELLSDGKLQMRFIPTKLQVANIFNNPLAGPLFAHFYDKLRVVPPPISLEGR